jgi:hypothetical protein
MAISLKSGAYLGATNHIASATSHTTISHARRRADSIAFRGDDSI